MSIGVQGIHIQKIIRTAVNDTRARLVVLLLGAPQVLERREGSQDGTTNPDGVFSLRGCNDLDFHARRRE